MHYFLSLLFFFLACCSRPLLSQNVLEMGYSKNNSYRTTSHLSRKKHFTFKKIQIEEGKNAIRNVSPLLYHNFKGERILIFFTYSFIISYNLNLKKILWKQPFKHTPGIEGNPNYSAPLIDLKYKKIYFITTDWNKEQKEKGRQVKMIHRIFQIDIDGKNIKSFPIDIYSLFPHKKESLRRAMEERISCKTAISKSRKGKNEFLYLGCGIGFAPEQSFLYGNNRGMSGLVMAFKLDAGGNILGQKIPFHVFETSRQTSTNHHGYDSGVYQLGGKFPVLSDNSILVATGNGPVDFEEKNFGCSVLKLNENLRLITNKDGTISAFTLFDQPSGECWLRNDEYSSHTIGFDYLGKSPIAAIASKHGLVTFFNPLEFNSKSVKKIIFRSTDRIESSYGSSPIWKKDSQKLRFYFSFNQELINVDTTLVRKDQLSQYSLKNGLIEKMCYGYILREKGLENISLYFSGLKKHDYAVGVTSSLLVNELTSRFSKFFSEESQMFERNSSLFYRKIDDLGSLIHRTEQASPFLATVSEFSDYTLWKKDVSFYKEKQIPDSNNSNWGFFKHRGDSSVCHTSLPENIVSLYQIKIHRKKPFLASHRMDGSFVVAVDVDADLNISKAWTYVLPIDKQLAKTHSVLSTNSKGEHPILVLLLEDRSQHKANSTVFFINGENGTKRGELPLVGLAHYTMSLLFDEYFFIATNEGLNSYLIEEKISLP